MKRRKLGPPGDSVADGIVVLTNCRPAPAIEVEPRTSMHDWRIVELDDGRSLVGFLENGFTCRLTTEIVSIDLPARQVRTSSGRLYELLGPPASEPERLAVITAHLVASAGSSWMDVTDSTWTAMCKATA